MNKEQFFLILSGISATSSLIFSFLSIGKLKSVGIGDYNTLLLVFRIVNRDIILLSLAVLFLVIYLLQKKK